MIERHGMTTEYIPIWTRELSDTRIGGLVGATPVWTNEGLKPIEQVKVGDLVLSSPGAATEKSYKKVEKTFVTPEMEVMLLEFLFNSEEESRALVLTINQPVAVVESGWKTVRDVDGPDLIEVQDDGFAQVIRIRRIFNTDAPDIGWTCVVDGSEGPNIDLSNNDVRVGQPSDYVYNEEAISIEDNYFKRTVFQLALEGGGGFYAAEPGLLVRSIIS
jgi:hypothetical protein